METILQAKISRAELCKENNWKKKDTHPYNI